MESREIQVFYPFWIKTIVIIGVPLLTLIALWLPFMAMYETDLTDAQRFLFPPLSLVMLYQCFIGFKCLRYLGAVLVIHDEGVGVYHKSKSKEYLWSDLIVKDHAFATTTAVITKSGKTIGYFSHGLPNLALLVDIIENGIT